MTKRILFVGEDQSLWQEFRARFPEGDGCWLAELAHTGAEALALLDRIAFSAVVADVQLCDRSGLELLDEVMRRQPQALRVVLSETADTPGALQCVGTAHHHLMKPCDASTLMEALEQAVTLETWLPSRAVQGLLARVRQIPSPPTIYFQLTSEMGSPDASIEKIGELIGRDPAISAKVLQLANSAVFGLQLKVVRPEEAVIYIGLETTKALVLLAHTFSAFDELQLGGFCVESLWWHSVLTGRFAQRIAALEQGGEELAGHASSAGLLHDIGKLLLAANLPEPFGQAMLLAREGHHHLWEAEDQVFGANHAELGACLLGIWGLPVPLVEAVARHHCPIRSRGEQFTALTAVHAANTLAHQAWANQLLGTQPEMDLEYLKRLQLDQRVQVWHDGCLGDPETPDKVESSEPSEPVRYS